MPELRRFAALCRHYNTGRLVKPFYTDNENTQLSQLLLWQSWRIIPRLWGPEAC